MTADSTSPNLTRLAPLGGLLAILGIGMAFATGGEKVMQSYVYGWIFSMGLVLGALALILLHHTIRATWTLSILRLLEAAASPTSLLIMFLAWIPIALNLTSIYHWADHHHVEGDIILENKAFFLNPTVFIVGSICYFALFLFYSAKLRGSSLQQDKSMDASMAQRRANIAAPGLVIYVLVVTLALTHWAMSLEPHWFSTVYGLLSLVGQANCVVALGVIVICANAHKAPFNSIVNAKLTKDLGNILFATTMVWAYLTLSQFLITWSGNLPEEVPYYKARAEMGWHIMGIILIVGRFFIPFLALLAPRTKRYARSVMIVSAWIVVMHLCDVFWLVVPAFERGGLLESFKLSDLGALIGFIGLFLAGFGLEIRRGSLVATHDPRLTEQPAHA